MHAASTEPVLGAPQSAYLVGGRRFKTDSPGFAEAIAAAHAAHHRPRCLCLVDGVEMYVARLGDGFIVKRMPNTGSHHVPDCPSYEPPAEFSGDIYQSKELPRVPGCLRDAITALDGSEFARRALGSEVVEHYLHFFRTEQRKFDAAVTDWEKARFFERG